MMKQMAYAHSLGVFTSETHCPRINATFLWIIRMFGLSFVSSKDNAPLNLYKSVSECPR